MILWLGFLRLMLSVVFTRMHDQGEIDVRACYTAISVSQHVIVGLGWDLNVLQCARACNFWLLKQIACVHAFEDENGYL